MTTTIGLRNFLGAACVLGLLVLLIQAPGRADTPRGAQYINQSELLDGLAPGAVYPFVDTTPYKVVKAHIAVTDAAADCNAGAAAPSNVQVLVGQAGVALQPVMSSATNTGISTTPGQCVFHVTVRPGQNGVPDTVTDIAVLNGSDEALSGVNTVTVSAVVR